MKPWVILSSLVYVGIIFSFWGVVLYVAYHFISKFW